MSRAGGGSGAQGPATPPVRDASVDRPWVMPTLLGVSFGAHALLLLLATFLPPPAADEPENPSQLAFTLLEPEPVIEPEPVVEPEPEPEPEPEAVVEQPAAVVERPRPEPVEPEPAPEPQVEPEEPPPVAEEPPPPPPAPVLTTGAPEGGGDWAHPEGEAGGRPGGTPGGTGDGPVTNAPVAEAPPQPRGISRAELRRRLLGYMRGTLWSFVNGRIDYPISARRNHLEGVVMLRIRLASDGRLLDVRLSRSSGHSMLDQAALASVQRIGTLPAPPDSIPWDASQELPLPVTYQLVQ